MWGGEAPSYICWGHNNRSAMIRVPMYKPLKGQSTRIELRTLDAACNPYLAYAVVLAAGMKGIEEGYELPREAEDDVWSLSERERKSLGIEPLPRSLVRRHRHRRELRAARRHPRRARLRLLPAQQARRVGRLPRPGLALRARPHAPGGVMTEAVPQLRAACRRSGGCSASCSGSPACCVARRAGPASSGRRRGGRRGRWSSPPCYGLVGLRSRWRAVRARAESARTARSSLTGGGGHRSLSVLLVEDPDRAPDRHRRRRAPDGHRSPRSGRSP